jgi:hypothetical protein
VTPDETAAAAVQFLTLYVEGSRNPSVVATFPEATNAPGIFLRQPALLGPPPDYEPYDVSPSDGQLFAPGEGPEASSLPYIFVDRCPVAQVRVQQSGTLLTVEFDCIVDFPVEAFPIELPAARSTLVRRRVLLPASMAEPQHIAAECITQMEEYLGVESTQLSVTHDVALMKFEEYHGTPI